MKILLWLFPLLIVTPVFGQEDIYSLSLEQLRKIKISGSTLTDESIKSVPAAVSVFSHEQIQRLGFDYLHELLNLVPGYQSQRTGDFSQNYAYSSRGRRNESQSKEVLVVMDGRTINDPRTSSANLTVPLILLEQVERVEIIRGPGSAIYGSSAFTGVINIITRKGETEAGLSVGSSGQGKAHQLWSYQEGSWQVDLFAQAYRDSGESYNVQDTFSVNRIDTEDPRQAGQFDFALGYRDTLLRASVRQFKADDFYLLDRLSNGFNRAFARQSQISLEQDFSWLADIRSHLFLSYQLTRQELGGQLTAPGELALVSIPSSSDALRLKGLFEARSYQLKLQNDWQLSNDVSVQFGGEWRDDSELLAEAGNNFDLGQLVAGDFPINFYGDFEQITKVGTEDARRIFGLYVQYQQSLQRDTDLLLGLRYDDYSDVGSRLSPRLGLVYQLNDTHTIKLLYGEAFRAPALNETGLINNPVTVGNPDLKHEVVKTWDLIWQGLWQETSVSLGWFQNRFEAPIIQQLVGENVRSWVNGENEQAQGVELETSYQIGAQWLLRGSLTRLTELPDSAFREADTLASILINYEKSAWNFSVTGVYHSGRDMLVPGDTHLTLDDYWLFNSKLRYRVNKSCQTFIQIKNMLDEDYKTAAQSRLITQGIPNRGREVSFGMLWEF